MRLYEIETTDKTATDVNLQEPPSPKELKQELVLVQNKIQELDKQGVNNPKFEEAKNLVSKISTSLNRRQFLLGARNMAVWMSNLNTIMSMLNKIEVAAPVAQATEPLGLEALYDYWRNLFDSNSMVNNIFRMMTTQDGEEYRIIEEYEENPQQILHELKQSGVSASDIRTLKEKFDYLLRNEGWGDEDYVLSDIGDILEKYITAPNLAKNDYDAWERLQLSYDFEEWQEISDGEDTLPKQKES